MRKLVIIGAGGHGKVVAECAARNGYEDIIFLDDDIGLKECGKYPVAGTAKEFRRFMEDDNTSAHFFVAIGNSRIRRQIQKEVESAGGLVATLIHPNAIISNDVDIRPGTVVMAGGVINVGAIIGTGCIINTASSVDHDCSIGDFVHIAVGTHIAGNVKIGHGTWIGAGATVSNNVNICGDCIIGAG